jgi:membrane-associated protease RseP (regulator of RpoE activity)
MAAAGPGGNFIIAAVAFVLMRVGLAVGAFVAPDQVNFQTIVAGADGQSTFITMLLSVLLVQNVLLGMFNLLPLPPLDGGSVFSIFLPEHLGRRLRELQRNGALSMVGLLVAWRLFPMLTGPLFSAVLKLVHPGASYG